MDKSDSILVNTGCRSFYSPDSSFGFEVYPKYGAQLNKIVLKANSSSVSILKSFASESDRIADEYFTNILLFPFVNRLEDGIWRYNEQVFQFPINEPSLSNSIHGFIYRQPFEIIENEITEKEVMAAFLIRYSANYDYYPFHFDMLIRYSIKKGREFILEAEIVNTGDTELPFSFGWHPYFDFADSVEDMDIQFPADSFIEVDSRFLPIRYKQANECISQGTRIGNQTFDNCYKLIPGAVRNTSITNKESGLRLTIEQDHTFDHSQIFIPPGRKLIAVEPLTAGLFAVKTGDGLIKLAPQETYNGAITVKLQTL